MNEDFIKLELLNTTDNTINTSAYIKKSEIEFISAVKNKFTPEGVANCKYFYIRTSSGNKYDCHVDFREKIIKEIIGE